MRAPRLSASDVRPRTLTIAVAAAAGLFTLVVNVFPIVHFAYRGPAAHVALETTGALVVLLSAYLVLGRLRRSGDRSDLALVAALTLLALSNLAFSALPAATGHGDSSFATWSTVVGTLLAGITFALAAAVPAGPLKRPRRDALKTIAGCLLALALIAGVVAVFGSELPRGIDPALNPEAPGRPRAQGSGVFLAIQLLGTACFGFAAWRFAVRAEQSGDELMRWLAVGMALSAFARFNYFLFPSRFSEWIYTGDILRFGFHVALLVGAVLEIARYQRGVARAAVLDERRRVARQLHDGLAQELAFIVTQARRLASKEGSDDTLAYLATAGERALAESRHAIAALTQPADESLDVGVARVADEIAHRGGMALELDLTEDTHVGVDAHEALLRIVREAMTNAAHHGRAQHVAVTLSRESGVTLRIVDDGVGFDPSEPREPWRGLGLASMRERAEALGGELRIDSRPGSGTRIEVVLP